MYNWGHCLISGSLQFTVYSFLEFPSILDFCPDLFFFKILLGLGSKGSLFSSHCKYYSIWVGSGGYGSLFCKGNIVVVF